MLNDDQITRQALYTHGVSLCEYFLMCTVGYRILLPPAGLIKMSASLSEGDPRGEFTPVHYMAALNACIQKNWLQLVTDDLFQDELNRRLSSGMPEILESSFVPGVIDFTQAGYFLYRQIIIDIFGNAHVDYKDSGWTIDEYHQRVDVYAPTLKLCIKRMQEFKEAPSDYIGHQVGSIIAHDPEPIDDWKPNRFITLPHGFHAVMYY
jgi:hypothetical protein